MEDALLFLNAVLYPTFSTKRYGEPSERDYLLRCGEGGEMGLTSISSVSGQARIPLFPESPAPEGLRRFSSLIDSSHLLHMQFFRGGESRRLRASPILYENTI